MKEEIIDEFGQLPMELDFWLMENAPQKVEVDYFWLRNVLIRLVYLRRLAKNHIAEADIPMAIEYLLSIVPDKIKKKLKCQKKSLKNR